MGTNKSKPIAESARKVLEKRAVLDAKYLKNNQPLVNNNNMKIDLHYDEKNFKVPTTTGATTFSNGNSNINNELDPIIFKEMSKWPSIKVSNSADNQLLNKAIQPNPEIKSAALIRIDESKQYDLLLKNINSNSSNTSDETTMKSLSHIMKGRLAEAQLIQLLDKLRDTPLSEYPIAKAAIEYNLSEESIEQLYNSVRTPILVNHIQENTELVLAK